MTQHQSSDPTSNPPGRLMVAGVLGACALGAGLGMWARPASPVRPAPPPVAEKAEPPRGALQIVIEEAPEPIGRLLEVLPDTGATEAAAPVAAPPAVLVEPEAPRRPASGLLKVGAEPVTVLPPPAVVELKPPLRVPPAAVPDARPRPAKAAVKTGRAEQQAAARKAQAKADQLAALRAEKARKAKALKLAQAQKARQAEHARAEKVRAAQLAKAEAAKARKADQAQKARPVKLAKAVPKKSKVEAKANGHRKAQLASARPSLRARPERATPRAPTKVERASSPAARAAKRPAARGSGPMRVARAQVCAADECDGRLGARDRQLQRAYRNAQAAGVSAAALRRQQDRWLHARAAAARDAPWAVEDVYEAQISELNDLTRFAREN